MFNIIGRRLQRYYFWLKLLLVLVSGTAVGVSVYYTEPDLLKVLGVTILIWIFLLSLLSLFINSRTALLLSIGVSFLLFLRAVDLLTPVNLVLLLAFLALLGIYFRNPKQQKEPAPEAPVHRKEVLFPKNWPFRVDKKKPQE